MEDAILKFLQDEISDEEYMSLLREASLNSEDWNDLVVLQNIKAKEAIQNEESDVLIGVISYEKFMQNILLKSDKTGT